MDEVLIGNRKGGSLTRESKERMENFVRFIVVGKKDEEGTEEIQRWTG